MFDFSTTLKKKAVEGFLQSLFCHILIAYFDFEGSSNNSCGEGKIVGVNKYRKRVMHFKFQ